MTKLICDAKTFQTIMRLSTNHTARFTYVPEYATANIRAVIGENKYTIRYTNTPEYYEVYAVANEYWCTHKHYNKSDYRSTTTSRQNGGRIHI